jgi:hypothetical protein
MRYLKFICLLVLGSTIFWGYLFATPRAFPGLPITSRIERWATESWRYFSPQGYSGWLERTRKYTDRLTGSGEDTTGEFVKRKEREEINLFREQFLAKDYPEELVVDSTIKEVDGKKLLRWWWFHRKKTKIVLHHTVTRQVTTKEDAQISLQEMYKQHTIKQSWGDIGYNFLLDPMGTIYEGRSWGKDVIGAHADRNNTRTIWVALMWNYDMHHPSSSMRRSLKKLLLSLSLQYGIDPFTKQTYFTAIDKEPRLVAGTHTSLVGHSDTKNTACPGRYVEDRLPVLRKEIDEVLKILQWRKKASLDQFRFLPKKLTFWMKNDLAVAVYPMSDRIIRDCKLLGNGVTLKQCGGDGKNLVVTVERSTATPSGQYALLVDTDAGAVWIDVVLVWQSQLDTLFQERKQQYPLLEKPQKQLEKIEKKIPLAEARDLSRSQISVLLYEPTTALPFREMQCESWCAVLLDQQRFWDVRLIRVQPSSDNPEQLTVFLDLKKYETTAIRLINPRSVITFLNRERWSTQFPLNYFRGDISLQRESYTTVDKKEKTGRTVVNHLPVEQYFRGIAETIETQHKEKLRTMALLVKSYTLFYLWGNRHPSVPVGVSYQAIDDPRLFQKYVGAWIEQSTPFWQQAISKTVNEFVVYDRYIPLLPYFHCSAGFIRSGNERFGRTDTPRLVSKLDVARCAWDDFEGHGVGLSGDGAEKLAQKWATYQKIIRYYYPGVQIVNEQ